MSDYPPSSEADKALDNVEKLRERFSAWGSAFASVCIVIAVWITAPALDVDVPLASDAKVKLNVGYVLAVGMPAIAVVYAWISGTLIAMRRYQAAAGSGATVDAASSVALVKMAGALTVGKSAGRFERIVVATALCVRILLLFGIPLLAQGWIAARYYGGLQVYPEHHLEDRRSVLVSEHLLGFAFARTLGLGPGAPAHARFAIVNGDLETACELKWSQGVQQQPAENQKCALDQFPRFVLPFNSILNLASLLITACFSFFGMFAYLCSPYNMKKRDAKLSQRRV